MRVQECKSNYCWFIAAVFFEEKFKKFNNGIDRPHRCSAPYTSNVRHASFSCIDVRGFLKRTCMNRCEVCASWIKDPVYAARRSVPVSLLLSRVCMRSRCGRRARSAPVISPGTPASQGGVHSLVWHAPDHALDRIGLSTTSH